MIRTVSMFVFCSFSRYVPRDMDLRLILVFSLKVNMLFPPFLPACVLSLVYNSRMDETLAVSR